MVHPLDSAETKLAGESPSATSFASEFYSFLPNPAWIIETAPSPALVIFVGAALDQSQELFLKMVTAMGLKPQQYRWLDVDSSFDVDSLSSIESNYLVLMDETLEVPIAFRDRYVRTLHPLDVMKKPENKRKVWNDLLAVAKNLGLKHS